MARWSETGETGEVIALLESVTASGQQSEMDKTEWSEKASGHRKV